MVINHFWLKPLVKANKYTCQLATYIVIINLRSKVANYICIIVIKPGARGRNARAWFLEIALVRASVCVCVRPRGH